MRRETIRRDMCAWVWPVLAVAGVCAIGCANGASESDDADDTAIGVSYESSRSGAERRAKKRPGSGGSTSSGVGGTGGTGATTSSGGSVGEPTGGGTGGVGSGVGGTGGTGATTSSGGSVGEPTGGGTGGVGSGSAGGLEPTSISARLLPQAGVAGTQRVNFAVPFAPGALVDASAVRVLHSGAEVGAARRVLAAHGDGSVRSLEIQFDLAVTGETSVELRIGELATVAAPSRVSVESTLATADGTTGPRVWALLPADWSADSGIAGPLVTESDVAGTPLSAWSKVCNYQSNNVDAFLPKMTDPAVWLFDRGTVFYRGYARRGDLVTLETAYRETAIYRSGMTGSGASTSIGVPGKATDLKYHYAQNLALHYLFTGDDRFRESAENIADKVAALWPSPGYAGGADFWTERNAGFALLAYVWAGIVSDDRAATFMARADTAVDAYLSMQSTFPAGYTDAAARCFAHHADAAGEPYGYFGCSPWMSAILADALEVYAAERGGERATQARQAIIKLGRILARQGRDTTGRPYYWMGVGTSTNEVDDYEEHWGESAYVVAMAYHLDGRRDATLRKVADELVAGLAARGTAPHMRSMNWQCRSAVATPFFLVL